MASFPQEPYPYPYRRPEDTGPRWSVYVLASILLGLLLVYGLPLLVQRITAAVNLGRAQAARAELGQMKGSMTAISANFRAVARAVAPAVVHIATSKTVPSGRAIGLRNPFFGPADPAPSLEEHALGSGVIMDRKGYILTNNHVVAGASEITVQLGDTRSYDATVVGTDPTTDLAVIKIDADLMVQAEFGDSGKIEVGDWVLAIGNPFGLDQTVTSGIISAKGRQNLQLSASIDFIQTDAAINPGNSGGPLVDLSGKVIGINTAIFSESGGYQGIGFAIPSNMAREVFEKLIKTGRVVRGFLGVGIQNLTPGIAQKLGLASTKGALIAQVQPDSPAARAGLEIGDVVVEFDGHAVESDNQLRKWIGSTEIGKKVQVVLYRQGQKKTATVVLQEQPAEFGLHFQVVTLTPEIAASLDYPEDARGVVVARVEPGSPAAEVGLRRQMLIVSVDGTDVPTEADFTRMVRKHDRSKPLVLGLLLPNGRKATLPIPLS